jgi:hypothetical protein
MEKTDGITDVGEMKDRMMIDLFKKKLQEAKTDLAPLRGTWNEASISYVISIKPQLMN